MIVNRKVTGTVLGFVMGFVLLHPLSMVVQGFVHPDMGIRLYRFLDAFSVHHLPMAFLFGALGALFGYMNISYTLRLTHEQKRVRMLESLLPICSYCKKIRDDSGSPEGEGDWVRIDRYIAERTDTTFTHGMCPECHERAMRELDEDDDYLETTKGVRQHRRRKEVHP